MTAVKFGISFIPSSSTRPTRSSTSTSTGPSSLDRPRDRWDSGVNTKIKQLVADELGSIPMGIVMITSTERTTQSATAARAGGLNGGAAVDACRKASDAPCRLPAGIWKDKGFTPTNILFDGGFVFDEGRPDERFSFKDLVRAAYHQRLNLGERGFFLRRPNRLDPLLGNRKPFRYFTQDGPCPRLLIVVSLW